MRRDDGIGKRSWGTIAGVARPGSRLRAWCRRGKLAVFLVMTAARATAAEPVSPMASCDAERPQTLPLYVINTVGVSSALLTTATAETSAIWERAGVRLTWRFAPSPRAAAGGQTLVVILRHGPSRSEVSDEHRQRRSDTSLGWLYFDASGRPGNVIQLSFDAISALVRQGTALDLRVGTLPDHVQEPLLGRAVGRVIAHELGHWFAGRRHTRRGLMSATFRERELLDWWSPQLSRELATSTRLRLQEPCLAAVALASTPPVWASMPR